jgi:hypothetical protein
MFHHPVRYGVNLPRRSAFGFHRLPGGEVGEGWAA